MRPCLNLLLLATCLLVPVGSANATSIKCWENAEGVKECGHFVPPEFSQKRVEELNDRGIVVKVTDRARTKAEQVEHNRQLVLQKEEQQRQAKKHMYDQMLLNTFPTEHDLELSYRDNVDAVKGIVEVAQANTRKLRSKLVEVQSRAANHERAGEQAPKFLLAEMDKLKVQIAHNKKYINKKKQDIVNKDKKYQSDLKRYRKLKGTTATAAKP